jgi:hypothetical protein
VVRHGVHDSEGLAAHYVRKRKSELEEVPTRSIAEGNLRKR